MDRALYAKMASKPVITRGDNFRPGYGVVEVQRVHDTKSQNMKGRIFAVDFRVIESHDKANNKNEKANSVGSTVGFVQLPDQQQPAEGNIMMFFLAGFNLVQTKDGNDNIVLKDEDGNTLSVDDFATLCVDAVDDQKQILAGVRMEYDTRQSGTRKNPNADMTFVSLKPMPNKPEEVTERRKALGLKPL